jgi:hypothetical protein
MSKTPKKRPLHKGVLCSQCFRDAGLRFEANRIGSYSTTLCPRCGSTDSKKLTVAQLEALRDSFFSRATAPHSFQGYVPVLRIGGDHEDNDVQMPPATASDWLLIKTLLGGRLFYNTPRLFLWGITNHFSGPDASLLDSTISDICSQLRIRDLRSETELYRIRLNLSGEGVVDPSQYDSPPDDHPTRQFSRFDQAAVPILYASPSLAVCIHECRTTLNDEIVVATLRSTRDLRIADLSEGYIQSPETPFDDLKYFFDGLMLSSPKYDDCRRIAKTFRDRLRVDGFMYKSFFSNLVDGGALNYGFFGHPISEGKLEVASFNQVRIEKIRYDFRLGPVFDWKKDEK